MKLIYMLSALALSLQINAGTMNRVFDGMNAKCQDGYDAFNSKLNGVFSLSNPVVSISSEEVNVKLDIKFFECRKVLNEFKLVRVDYQSKSEITFMNKVISKIELSKELRAFSSDSVILASADLITEIELDKSSSIILTIPTVAMDTNVFSSAQSKGDLFVNLDLSTIREISSNESVVEREQITSGQYRLFINTKTQKALLE